MMKHHTAEDAALRMMAAQECLECFRQAQWQRRSWLSKVLWRLFH